MTEGARFFFTAAAYWCYVYPLAVSASVVGVAAAIRCSTSLKLRCAVPLACCVCIASLGMASPALTSVLTSEL